MPALIKRIKEAGEMSDAELAKSIGVSDRTIRYWLTGDRTPRGLQLAKLKKLSLSYEQETEQASPDIQTCSYEPNSKQILDSQKTKAEQFSESSSIPIYINNNNQHGKLTLDVVPSTDKANKSRSKMKNKNRQSTSELDFLIDFTLGFGRLS